jgi:hypothetical protein
MKNLSPDVAVILLISGQGEVFGGTQALADIEQHPQQQEHKKNSIEDIRFVSGLHSSCLNQDNIVSRFCNERFSRKTFNRDCINSTRLQGFFQ